jgi:hypothetical protein
MTADPGPVASPGHPTPADLLQQVVRDVERHVGRDGWDQPTRLFALAASESLEVTAAAPADAAPSPWVALEQSGLPAHDDALALLAAIEWPPDVRGAVVAFETVLVDADHPLPADPVAARQVAARAPGRQEARLVVAAVAEGPAAAALRWRNHDRDEDVTIADGALVPAVSDAVRATLRASSH